MIVHVITISLIISFSLSIALICEKENCGWSKGWCKIKDSYIHINPNYYYQLYSDYVYQGYTYCSENSKYILIEGSYNKTYLEQLQKDIYPDNSLHVCWFKGYNCDIKKKEPYSQEKFDRILYSFITFIILSILSLFYKYMENSCKSYDTIHQNSSIRQNSSINTNLLSDKPPPLYSESTEKPIASAPSY